MFSFVIGLSIISVVMVIGQIESTKKFDKQQRQDIFN